MNFSYGFPGNYSIPSFPINSSNATTELKEWTVMPIFSVITFIMGTIGNAALLLLFIIDHTLRTPFNIYLINLLIANLTCILIQYPMDIITNLYSFQWFMGESACTVYLYACLVLEAVILNSHQLIAINRIWAVVHPLSYRARHNVRTAVILCTVTWIIVHIVIVPGWIVDAVSYRLPVLDNGCILNANAQPVWNIIILLVIFDPPLIMVLLAFPLIKITRFVRRRKVLSKRRAVVAPILPIIKTNNSTFELATINNIINLDEGPRSSDTYSASRSGVPVKKHNSHAYVILAMLTIGTAICWTPFDIYFTILVFMDINLSITFYQVATILFSCQTMLDPILLTVALKSLRVSLRRNLFGYTE